MTSRSALVELSLANSRELLRSGKTIFGMLFVFVFFLVVVWVLHLSFHNNRDAPVVGIVGDGAKSQQLLVALQAAEIDARFIQSSGASANVTVTVSLNGDSAHLDLGSPTPAWLAVSAAIHEVGIPTSAITATGIDGSPATPDFLRANLASILVMGLLAIAFMGTSVPLVALRERGTLRLFGTTPVRRLTFIVAQSPIRFALGAAEAAIILGIAAVAGYVESFVAVRLAVTLLLGLLMLFAFAYLLASRSRNADAIAQVAGFLPVIVIFTSGTVYPTSVLPGFLQDAITVIPTTWFMQAASADLAGTEPFTSVYLLWALMAATAVGVALLAARLFRWDRDES